MHGAHTCNHPATKTHLEPVAAGPEESTPATHTPTRLEQAAMGPERLNTYSRTPTWLGRPTRLEPAAVGSRQTRITVSPPIDRLLLAKMSETNFRSCAPILGFLPDFATDFGFLTLGFRRARARPPTCAMSPGRLPSEGCECTKFWWRHNLCTLRRYTEFGRLTPLARQRAHMAQVFRNS